MANCSRRNCRWWYCHTFSQTQDATYQATAKYLIDLAPTGTSSEYSNILTEERLASTYAELMTTRPVFEEVAWHQKMHPATQSKALLRHCGDGFSEFGCRLANPEHHRP